MRQVRPVTIYFPAGYAETGRNYPVVFFHDGPEFITLCQAPSILDFLIGTGAMEPVVGVFITPVDRDPEYSGDLRDRYTSFVALELLPAMEKRYRVSKSAANHALAGISNGGNIALYIGMHHPDKFMKVASLSGNVIPQIMEKFMESPPMNLVIYLDIGRYDIPILIEMNETLAGILKQKGYDFSYHRWPEGHSWGNWAGHLRHPLAFFFPGSGM
jgi:enterochelin esterase family protein